MINNNYSGQTYYARETNIMYQVYGWMCFALALTATTAYLLSTNYSLMLAIHKNPIILIVLVIAQLALVASLSFLINRISFAMAAGLFILYAASLGVTLSSIFLVYQIGSIFATFVVTAGMFGAMAIYGYFTKADLTAIGSIGLMALIGLIIGGLVNMFLKSAMVDYVLSIIGVLVFTLLTAYDVQKIKRMTQEMLGDRETMAKVSIIGALMLYLDFVNLFLYLLRIMGKRQES